jgi:anti-sigma factor RsiW
MKDDPALRQLRETTWRRSLTAAESAELRRLLAGDAAAAADWQLEARLSRAVARLPDAPVPSNFTARVLESIEREAAVADQSRGTWWSPRRWLPRLAFACVVLGVGVVGIQQYDRAAHQRMADSVAVISPLGALPTPEALVDFDAIRALGNEPAADVELLTLLQ